MTVVTNSELVGAEKTVWRSGLCDWSGDVCQWAESCLCWWGVQWRVWSEGLCSPRLGTQPIIVLETLSREFHSGVPGRISLPMTLLSLLNRSRNESGGSWLEAKEVASFCYLEDMLTAVGGCELSTATHLKTSWKKFKELLPVLSSGHLSFKNVAACTALVWGKQCSMPVRLGHWQSQTFYIYSEMTGQWSDR